MMENEAEINIIDDEVVEMEQVCAGEIGQHHTDGDGEQEKGLEFLDDRQVNEDTYDDVHDQKLPGGGVERPTRIGKIKKAVSLTGLGEQNLPNTRADQEIQQALNQFGHG